MMPYQTILFTNGSLWGNVWRCFFPCQPIWQTGCTEHAAADHTGNARIVVGVIDEGAMYAHEDLVNNFRNNPFITRFDGVDNDGNGFVDDVHGWDFLRTTTALLMGQGDDHGTHISGTIGAKGGNGKGVAGVCWNVSIFSAKFVGPFGGSLDDAILAVDYLTDLK